MSGTAPSWYTRYLSSKKTVDDRALNHGVVERLRAEIAALGASRVRVLEIGGGLGTMAARLIDWGLLGRAEYELLDVDADLLSNARAWLLAWAQSRGFVAQADGAGITVRGQPAIDVSVRFLHAELGQFLQERSPGSARADLIIANALLDLVEVPVILPRLFELVVPGGLYFSTINYDGETIFEPEHPDDERFMRVYHRSMDERVRYGRAAGDSKTGRHLFWHLPAAGATILAAGSSDHVVHGRKGRYPADEAVFLHQIVSFVDEELRKHTEIDAAALAAWVALRRHQIEQGELVYIAHQLDFVGRTRALPSNSSNQRLRSSPPA
jgi:SAM-dependent methyltransferase